MDNNNWFMIPGGKLLPGQSLLSPNGQYKFSVNNGQVTMTGPGVNWKGGTAGDEVGCLVLQSDGNLVLYDSNNHPLWSSGTQGNASFLVIQDDGNAVIYKLANTGWATNTSQQINSCSSPPNQG